jgi:glycosyltransferase involved in cell wall biosynthesis
LQHAYALSRERCAVDLKDEGGTVYIVWAPGSNRMDELSKSFGGKLWKFSVFFKMKASAPIKYPVQAFKTLLFLKGQKPNIVVAQNPPIFAPLTCLVYAKLTRRLLWIDHHCVWSEKSLRQPILRHFVRLIEAFCCRNADLNTAPNPSWALEIGRLNGGNEALTIVDFVDEGWFRDADLTVRRRMFPNYRWLLVAPCGGDPLERPDIAARAAVSFNDVALAITGRREHLEKHVEEVERLKADNVFFTGYLPERQYKGLIATCDAAVNITDEPLTVPHFICEALAAGKPVVSTPNPAVKSVYAGNVLYVERNDVESLRQALKRLLDNYDYYASKARKAYERLRRMRIEQENTLKEVLEAKAKLNG